MAAPPTLVVPVRIVIERDDWTEHDGRSNSSPIFLALVADVERLIRSDAHMLISGHAENTALLIVAQLAHVHHLGPITPQQPEAGGQ